MARGWFVFRYHVSSLAARTLRIRLGDIIRALCYMDGGCADGIRNPADQMFFSFHLELGITRCFRQASLNSSSQSHTSLATMVSRLDNRSEP